ncbi:hypothetical protein PL2TA16_00042 [Pseudoalteromonas luteoviolacea 2ta16]|uniref:Uncharacterized protein n=1 Tax=Pseudoalteromonas luteoviolacea (strain 2ta16) TaxID=1353533 RepID=V4HYJ2_PSEL2|nr:hypothetical protein PL2TA16_00042 [Pseudoalteromonas luteoviolacea 2ta16]
MNLAKLKCRYVPNLLGLCKANVKNITRLFKNYQIGSLFALCCLFLDGYLLQFAPSSSCRTSC